VRRAQCRHLTNLRPLGCQLDRAAGRHGQRVIRVTWQQATAHAAQTAQRVTLALAGPGAEEPADNSSSRAERTTGTT